MFRLRMVGFMLGSPGASCVRARRAVNESAGSPLKSFLSDPRLSRAANNMNATRMAVYWTTTKTIDQ
eukprot:766725-Hanusia_phi.AAC.5